MTEDNSDGAGSELFVSQPPVTPSPTPHSQREAQPIQGILLDFNDPFERGIADVVHLYRYRRPTLDVNGNIYETYASGARFVDMPQFGVPEALLHIIGRELAHINAMRRKGTLLQPGNDETNLSYLEVAFNAAMLFSWIKEVTKFG